MKFMSGDWSWLLVSGHLLDFFRYSLGAFLPWPCVELNFVKCHTNEKNVCKCEAISGLMGEK